MDETERQQMLDELDFGKVDAEAESDLDERFVRTRDFQLFVERDTQLVLGAKGTGKSAIFDLFARFEPAARAAAGSGIDDVVVVTGAGLSDIREIATGDLTEMRQSGAYDDIWRLYIGVKTALTLAPHATGRGPVVELLKAAGQLPDRRLGPLLKGLWTRFVAPEAPGKIGVATVSIGDFERGPLDVSQLLYDIDHTLEMAGKRAWVLFDKVDELFPSQLDERTAAIEGLVAAALALRRTYPRIQPRIFLRTDIWADLNVTNKTHLVDKTVTLSWSRMQLARLLLKGAAVNTRVRGYLSDSVPGITGGVENLSDDEVEAALTSLLPEKVYPGEKEAGIIDWIHARVTDARETAFPRETILLGNYARRHQLDRGGPTPSGERSLISREAVRDAFADVSEQRVTAYLAEFPTLRKHFQQFKGKTQADFSRAEVETMMDRLEPGGVEMFRSLLDVGVLKPLGGNEATAQRFEIPRLYRQGLGLVIRGRP